MPTHYILPAAVLLDENFQQLTRGAQDLLIRFICEWQKHQRYLGAVPTAMDFQYDPTVCGERLYNARLQELLSAGLVAHVGSTVFVQGRNAPAAYHV